MPLAAALYKTDGGPSRVDHVHDFSGCPIDRLRDGQEPTPGEGLQTWGDAAEIPLAWHRAALLACRCGASRLPSARRRRSQQSGHPISAGLGEWCCGVVKEGSRASGESDGMKVSEVGGDGVGE